MRVWTRWPGRRAGLVDVVVATPFWATAEFDLPMVEWRQLLAGTKAQLGGGLEIRYQPVPDGPSKYMTPELAAGAAMAVLHGGADLVYLYNYFPGPANPGKAWNGELARDWGAGRYPAVLRAMQSEGLLDSLPRTHAVTYRAIRAPGEPPDHARPAVDRRQDMPWPPGCAFRVQTGPKPVGRAVELTVEFTPDTAAPKMRGCSSTVWNVTPGFQGRDPPPTQPGESVFMRCPAKSSRTRRRSWRSSLAAASTSPSCAWKSPSPRRRFSRTNFQVAKAPGCMPGDKEAQTGIISLKARRSAAFRLAKIARSSLAASKSFSRPKSFLGSDEVVQADETARLAGDLEGLGIRLEPFEVTEAEDRSQNIDHSPIGLKI